MHSFKTGALQGEPLPRVVIVPGTSRLSVNMFSDCLPYTRILEVGDEEETWRAHLSSRGHRVSFKHLKTVLLLLHVFLHNHLSISFNHSSCDMIVVLFTNLVCLLSMNDGACIAVVLRVEPNAPAEVWPGYRKSGWLRPHSRVHSCLWVPLASVNLFRSYLPSLTSRIYHQQICCPHMPWENLPSSTPLFTLSLCRFTLSLPICKGNT